MYPFVAAWLKQTVKGIYPRAAIETYDTSAVALYRFLERESLHTLFPDFKTYEIHVDITAVIRPKKDKALLGFVECKLDQISLRDISQLLGYSRVALPMYSIIAALGGVTSAVHYLLDTYSRLDVLEYAPGRRLKVATWDAAKAEVHVPSLLPPGDYE
jgi:hypothetical protein